MREHLPYLAAIAAALINIVIKGISRSPAKFKLSDLNFSAESSFATLILISQYFINHSNLRVAEAAEALQYPILAMVLSLLISIAIGQKVDELENGRSAHLTRAKFEFAAYIFLSLILSGISIWLAVRLK